MNTKTTTKEQAMSATITTPHGTITATVDPDQSDLTGTGYIRLVIGGEALCWAAENVTVSA